MRKALFLVLYLVLSLVIVGCGTNSDKDLDGNSNKGVESSNEAQNVEEEETPQSIEIEDASGDKVTFDTAPESIAVLNSGDLDILQALGVNITGRPTASGPVDASLEEIAEIGNPHQANFEKIAEVHPDVLAASLSFQQYAENLEKQGTKVVYTQANSIEDIIKTIDMFGSMFEKQSESENIIESINEKIEKIEKANPVKTLLVYGAPGTYLAALPNSLSGDLLEKVGGENIASDFPHEENYPQYASLSVEKIIERNPEVVMLITHGDPEAVKDAFEEEMSENAAWKNLDAVKNGNVVVLPSHLFGTNPGTKVTDALQVMQESLLAVE